MKTGIIGGSFDPVHCGHIRIAEYFKNTDIDRIMFMPLGVAPYKTSLTDKELRIEMLEQAIKDMPYCSVSRLEADKAGKTYTYDTLLYLRQNTDDDYVFIIGADKLSTLGKWYRAQEIFRLAEFEVIPRKGCETCENLRELIKMGAKLHFAEFRGNDISSTLIRERVRRGESISGLVAPEVERIIREHKLYQNQ